MAILGWLGNVGALDPLSIVTSKNAKLYLIGDLGITIGTGVSAWADQSGNSAHASQGTAGFQPSYNLTGLNGKGTVLFDGSDDFLNFTTFSRPAPATTPSWFWIIFRQITWTNTDSIFGGTATSSRLYAATSTPSLYQRNSASINGPNGGAVINTWTRGEVLFTGSSSDSLKLASTVVTGGNSGNTSLVAGNFNLGSHLSSAGWSNIEVAAFACWDGEPTSIEKTSLDTWANAYYQSVAI